MTKVHSVAVLTVPGLRGLQIFFVRDLMPVPEFLSCKMPGRPAKLKPERGRAIFLAATCPVGSLAIAAEAAGPPPEFFFTPADPPIEDLLRLLELFFGVAAVAAAAAPPPEGAPTSPEAGEAKNLSTSAIFFCQLL